ncbi:conserved membrane protein of unknown function [Thermococcus nautili]|uniref:hypothetical protein n=1 Tax=Thermococcus nautili TaxID=195522 RepID=UPI002556098A|nr:hypothetical protein [Thermococcus nautili]CAI1492695.1 conserved membrane protein of unknown function [Thermococcus nautili]
MKRPLRYIPFIVGLLSLIYLFFTGDNYSETAYPLLQLNLYLTALVAMLPWIEDERFGFEVKVFAPLWLSIAALLAGMDFLDGLAAILWLAWLFLPLLKIDSLLFLLKRLTENLKLKKSLVRTLLIVLIPPVFIVMWYHIIFGMQAVVLTAVYALYIIFTEFKESENASWV